MSLEYSRSALRVTVAQICQNLGWNSIHSTPLELLTDVLERYLVQLSRLSHRYSEQFGLTDPRIEDVGLALNHMGVSLSELEDFVRHVDPTPFPKEVVAFPAPRPNDLKFPNPDSKEVQQRKVFEFVPEHLPYMHPELNEDTEDSNPPPPASPDRLQVEQTPQTAELSPGVGEKRPISSPGDSNMPFKRPRLTTSHLPDEASHSQYEITSVVMTHSGILSPLRQGKIPDSRTPPVAKQIVIVKSVSSGAQKGPDGQPMPGGSLNPETPIIKLDFSKDPAGQTKIVEVGGDGENATQVNLNRGNPEFKPKKKSKDKTKPPKIFKIKRGPGRPRSPGRAPPVIHKKSDQDIYKMLTLPRKDDSLGKTHDLQGPIDLTVKPTPSLFNVSVKLDESLKSKSEYKQKTVVISKEQEKDMEDTIASVIQQSAMEPDISSENNTSHPPPVIFREGGFHEKTVKKDTDSKQEDVWRVSSITETDTDENAHDSFEGDNEKNGNLLSPPPSFFMAPHLRLLQSPVVASPPRKRGRPRGSTSSIHRGSLVRGRARGRPPLNRSPIRSSPGRPPLNRSPGRPPLNRSPGRPPGSGRSPGRPKGSTKPHHSPKPRGRPRGSKSPRSRGGSPRGMSPRGAIQNINFDVNLSDIVKPEREDSNDSEATNFEFPTQSPESDTDKKSFELDDADVNKFDLADSEPSSPVRKITPEPSPVPSPKTDFHETSPVPQPPVSKPAVKKEDTPETPTTKRLEKFVSKREPSSDFSDRESKEKLQDSEDDSRKTTNYGEIDNQSRVSEDRESSSERAFKHHFHKDRSSDREKRDSSREWDNKDTEERERKKDSEDRTYSNETKEDLLDRSQRETSRERDSLDRGQKETSMERDYRESSKEREYRELSREKEPSREKEHKKDKEHKEHTKEKEHKAHSKEKEPKEHSKEREHKEHNKDREHKEHRKDKEHKARHKEKEHSIEREHKERSKEREPKEYSIEREHKEHSKEREHKEHSKEREPKEHSKDREHKEHKRDKEHKKDKKKKKKKDKDKDRERDKDEKKEKRERDEKKDKRDKDEKKEKRDKEEKKEKRDKEEKKEKKEKHKSKEKEKESREESASIQPFVQKLKIKIGGGTSSSPGSFSVSTAMIRPSPVRESLSPVHRPEIPKLKFKVLPPKPDSEKDRNTDPQQQSWTSVKQEVEKVPTPKPESRPASPDRTSVKSEPMEADSGDEDDLKGKEEGADNTLNTSEDAEVERVVTVSVIKGKITGIGGAKKPGKRGKRKGSVKKGKPKIPKLVPPAPSPVVDTKVLPVKKVLDKASSESPSHLFSTENVPSPITIPALKAAPPPPSPPASKKSPPKPKPVLKEKEIRVPSPLLKEAVTKPKPPPVTIPKAAKVSKSPRRSSPRKSPKFSPPTKKKGGPVSTPASKSPSSKPTSPNKSTPFYFTVPRTPSPSPLSTPSHSAHSSPMYSPASSPSRDSLSFTIPPTPAFQARTTSPPLSPPSRQISTDEEKEATPPVDTPKMPPPALPPMPPSSAMRRQQRGVVAETIGSFVNESGDRIWICPTCTMQDDGSPMVGCDICDDWYHWVCVGIKEEPSEDVWYCPKCKPNKNTQKKRGRKKKK